MSHPAKNYSHPLPRRGTPAFPSSLCFGREGSRTPPLSDRAAEALEGAEAAGFGPKGACACQ